jgi:hypothetical protein
VLNISQITIFYWTFSTSDIHLNGSELSLESESYVTTDGQPASLSWNKAPSGAYDQIFIIVWQLRVSLIWGALSDERTGLSFTIAAGPRQRSHFRVRVPLDSWPYFTVSDSGLPFSSPPRTRRVTVEVLDPASTRVELSLIVGFSLYSLGSDHSTENTSIA